MDEDELPALGTLPVVSTIDFDRSLVCFWRNFGNFELWDVDGGDEGDWECLAEEDIVNVVVAVVKVVEEVKVADMPSSSRPEGHLCTKR
ncbi:hypothetical protein PHLCEN_2v5621 [Hermanssonia centrifuga]|uniref:Uncharacterized protein n=1 Tax=Hermanssonia centrifuga TaxID=98765 RepID=A0A2R6P1Y1_9APHY|nr:hypothetical protein PHLCEN_2v5621 [Hermanssonia centrifuga]